MTSASEANGLSLRVACIAEWAGCDGLEVPETGHFSSEVLVEQGLPVPKISTPHTEIMFPNYSY